MTMPSLVAVNTSSSPTSVKPSAVRAAIYASQSACVVSAYANVYSPPTSSAIISVPAVNSGSSDGNSAFSFTLVSSSEKLYSV